MTNTTQRNAKPENKCNPKTGWLMPSKNVLKRGKCRRDRRRTKRHRDCHLIWKLQSTRQSTRQRDECDDFFRHGISGTTEQKQQRNYGQNKQPTASEIFSQVVENGANRPRELDNSQCPAREKDVKDNVRGTNKSRWNREKQSSQPNWMRGKTFVGTGPLTEGKVRRAYSLGIALSMNNSPPEIGRFGRSTVDQAQMPAYQE